MGDIPRGKSHGFFQLFHEPDLLGRLPGSSSRPPQDMMKIITDLTYTESWGKETNNTYVFGLMESHKDKQRKAI